MSAPKDEVHRLRDELPKQPSLEDIPYHIYVLRKIARGLDDVEAGRTLPMSEVEKRLAKWTRQ